MVGNRLTIDIATVNGESSGARTTDGKPQMDHPSRESDVFEEEPDELEVDLDTPWVKPSVEKAKKAGKVSKNLISAPKNGRNCGLLSLLLGRRGSSVDKGSRLLQRSAR